MLNYIQKGDLLDVVAPTGGVVSGQLIAVGALVGVAQTTATAGNVFAFLVTGVVSVPKATGAIAQGDKLYFDPIAFNITETSTGNILAGHAAAAALAGDAFVSLLLVHG